MIGKTLLHYEVKDQLGKGGMGEVFRALDTKLGREVALKVLPPEMIDDAERQLRFEREARALATLQHPNVASVYGFEEADGVRFLVMELVSGAELTERMKSGPVPVDEALVIARQVAAGLEAAHENGIVHRDLKPANIMETDEGEVKILDFGLAQAWFGDGPEGSESSSMPTITAAMTQAGAILGTAAYMSPEQARGINVDRRADIWAFGVIMFEMLTGQKLFHGETVSDTLAAVLRAEPDWSALPVDEAPELCHLIERCLERNPKQRLRDIGEARIFLQDGGASGSNLSFSRLAVAVAPAAATRSRPPVLLMAALALVGLLGGALLGWKVLAKPEPAPVLHAMIPPPNQTEYQLNGTAPGPAALSPDGKLLAFTAVDDEGVTRLYLRHLDKGESVALSGTEGAAYPFWSPDNAFVGFFVPGAQKLKKIAVGGGPPVTLCAAQNGKGGTWNGQGDILYAPAANEGIHRVPDIGGDPVRVTTVGEGDNSHRHPRFLPGGREFFFIARSIDTGQTNKVWLASLDTTVAPRIITESEGQAEYVDGHLLTVREGVLMATPFSPDQERLVEGGTPLVESVLTIPAAEVGVYSPAASGMIVFQTGASSRAGRQTFWTDLETGAVAPVGEPGQLFHPVVSPDGTRAMIEVSEASNEGIDLWLMDMETGLRTRFTFTAGDETRAVWANDGQSVIYRATEGGDFRIMQQPVDGQGGTAILMESKRDLIPTDTDPTDRVLLVTAENEAGDYEILSLSLVEGGEPVVVATKPDESIAGGVFSPDGRWIAYHSQTAAGWDIFVMPTSGGPRKWQVTSDGAVYPHWNADGSELWVGRFNGDLRAYSVDGSGDTFRVGDFAQRTTAQPPSANGSGYDLHPDGRSVLQSGVDPSFRAEVSYLHLVTDWRRGLVQ